MSTQEAFPTGTAVELDLTIPAPEWELARLAAGLGCRLTYQPGLCQTTDRRLVFVATDVDPATLLAAAADRDGIETPRLLTAFEGNAVLELESTTPTIVEVVADQGGRTERLVLGPTGLEVTVLLPNGGGDVRALHDALSTQFGQATLAARRDGIHPAATRPEFLAAIDEALTTRQRTALRRAHSTGFFDWPREVSGEDLATSMDISPSTYHQHLRAAERKVFDILFER